jgi:dTDP-4-dehydrorhamnose reductase
VKEIYLTGSKGLVGSRFLELASETYKISSPEIDELDITDIEALDRFYEKVGPAVLVHLAAFTDVGAAEGQRDDKDAVCWRVNVVGTRNLAEVSKKHGTRMIYISTDMVFPGSKENPGPYAEDHPLESDSKKITWYGHTKAEGERAVRRVFGSEVAILRIIYPVRANSPKPDYIGKLLALFDQGKPAFTDQQISISSVDEVTAVIKRLIDDERTGVFHSACRDLTTPHELISYFIERTRGKKDAVKESSLKDFLERGGNPVRYPMFGGLKVEETQKSLGIEFRSWKEIVDEIIGQTEV